jgi:hypothetical protein
MAEQAAAYQPFSCLDAIQQLCKRSRQNSTLVQKEVETFINEPFIATYKKYYYIAFEIVKQCQVPLCIIGQIKNVQRYQYACLMDVRHLDSLFDKTTKLPPVYWLFDVASGVLLQETTKQSKIPTLTYHEKKYNKLSASLWDILQVTTSDIPLDEPQSSTELQQVLQKHNLLKDTNVFYCISIVPQQEMPWVMGHTESPIAPLCFFAYTKPDLSIGYGFRQPQKLNYHNVPCIEDEAQEYDDHPDPSTANRKTAVNVKMSGLLLAHTLGLCSQQELQKFSQDLAKCVGALWLTCDEEKHVRHVVYKDTSFYKAIELQCEDQDWNVKHWTLFFRYIQKCASKKRETKKAILAPLLAKLEPFRTLQVRSLWSQCYTQLQTAIDKHKIFVFCNDDTVLHQLKVPIAGTFKGPRSKGIYLHTLANYTITALSTPQIVFINLAEYFNYRQRTFEPYNDDDTMWQIAQDWLPHNGSDSLTSWRNPELKHEIKHLKHHAKMELFSQTTLTYVADRATRNAATILQLWIALVTYCLVQFGYDLASLPHQSLAKMAFDIIWLNYAQQAGPFAHSLENLHPYTVFKLRPWCKGGFSYSFKGYLKRGDLLDKDKEAAKSICELDLSSAYGYSGMTMSAAKGFGIAFGEQVKTQRRYRQFEYMAAMYTIFKLNVMQGLEIKAVYSNYSPLGLIYLGKYALDLVVVMADNSYKFYQFDGHYCHGDYNQACPSLPHYANNQSRFECEKKTRERDEFILNWLMTVNTFNSTYEILTDCCHSEYSMANLKNAFLIHRPLKNLIVGLDQLDGTLDKADLSKVTFLAIVEGYATTHQERDFGPVFVTDDGDTPTVSKGKMLLTSDYYLYLKRNFDFKVTSIEWVIFYSICQDLPRVFTSIVSLRKQVGQAPSRDAFLKSIVNYACGYFGLNSDKTAKSIARITSKLPARFNVFRDEVKPLESFGKDLFMLVQSYSTRKPAKNVCYTPLVLFIQIIEFGKMRLNTSVQWLQQHLRPTSMRILYSNVDNLILSLSEDTLVEALEDQSKLAKTTFLAGWQNLYGKGPGLLKQEWCHKSDVMWQFVSPCRMFHVVLAADDSHHKSTFFTGLPTSRAFQVAMAVLEKQSIQVVQEKKKAKLVGTDTHLVTYSF